jgi:hypothetical protein
MQRKKLGTITELRKIENFHYNTHLWNVKQHGGRAIIICFHFYSDKKFGLKMIIKHSSYVLNVVH